MSGVFREIIMTHDGVDYTVVPNNRLLRRIEREVSLTEMIGRVSEGKPPVSEIAFVIAEYLRSAGADVDEDQMYVDLMTDLTENEGRSFAALCGAVVESITPVDDAPKKQKPRKAKKAKAA